MRENPTTLLPILWGQDGMTSYIAQDWPKHHVISKGWSPLEDGRLKIRGNLFTITVANGHAVYLKTGTTPHGDFECVLVESEYVEYADAA
jgi:hypothetical protein